MDRQAAKALIEQAYEARKTEDIEGLMRVFHPDGKFVLAGSKEHSPAAGTAQSHQEFRTTLAGLVAAFKFVERDIMSMVIENDRAAVHSRAKLRFVPKDRTVTTDILDVWKFEDGKIKDLVEFSSLPGAN
jgi:uncharacterized protein (TIGR02246 family)